MKRRKNAREVERSNVAGVEIYRWPADLSQDDRDYVVRYLLSVALGDPPPEPPRD